jgi:hypothetical protein
VAAGTAAALPRGPSHLQSLWMAFWTLPGHRCCLQQTAHAASTCWPRVKPQLHMASQSMQRALRL